MKKELFLKNFDLIEEKESITKLIEQETIRMVENLNKSITVQIKPKPKYMPKFIWNYLVNTFLYIEIKK
jgi:hypothetical protein